MSDKVCHPFMTIPNRLAIRAEKKLRVEINKRDKIYMQFILDAPINES